MFMITYGDGPPQPGRFITPAAHDNDNWGVAGNGQTPAEALQMIRRWKAQAKRELADDFSLRSDPEHRKTWEITLAMEKCALWIYWKVRKE
mgnify:CR=1 FL=1